MKRPIFSCLFVLALAPISVSAYELGTHGRLTYEAYKRSVIAKDPQILKVLDIDNAEDALGPSYYDVSGNEVGQREKHDFEQSQNRMPEEVDPLSVPGWLLRGAIREDDLGYIFSFKYGPDPHDDPYTPFWRVMNHFYDPVHNRPLTMSPKAEKVFREVTGDNNAFRKAPDWALGSEDAFGSPAVPDPSRRNHFTLVDANEAMYRALTGTDQAHQEIAKTQDERNKYWATTFRALGDVAHLVQDMAQPQHTRNDAHSGAPGYGHKSIYEAYIECRATGGILRDVIGGAGGKPCDPLVSGIEYPIPAFSSYGDYFSTREGSNGRGIADYSNRGFFSAGTNLGTKNSAYEYPPKNAASYSREAVATTDDGAVLAVLTGAVKDAWSPGDSQNCDGSSSCVPLTTEGAWYLPLAEFSSPANAEAYGYTLTRPNYDAMADLLIPRAVAYSAGIINHFFRARISARYVNHSPLATVGQAAMVVRNMGQSTLNGTFEVYYDKEDESRVLLATKEGSLPPIVEGQEPVELVVEFQAPVITTSETRPYTVVFKGHDEQATDEVVTGATAASAVLAFNGKDGLKTIDPKAVAATPQGEQAKLIRPYEGPFVAGSRTRPHPSNSAYALIFHPFSGQVGIVDYAANKTIDIAGTGSIRNTVAAANWLGDAQFIVASFRTQKTLNSSPFYPKATVTYTIYDWDPASSTYSLASQKVVPIALAPIYPSAAMGLFWGEPPWPRDGNWWSFDVNRKGEMVTAMYSATTESEPPVKNYVHPSNCANPVLVEIGEVSTTTYRYFILTIRPDGSHQLSKPVATSTDKTTAWRYYDTPNPPSYLYYCEGRLNKQTVDRAIRGARLAHVDFTPRGELALAVNEETSDWGQVANLPSPTSWNNETDYAATRSWKVSDISLATSKSTGNGSVNYDNGTQTSMYDESYRDIEIYDLQYDGTGKPWALWVDNHWQASSSGGGALKNDTAFYIGNGGQKSVLFEATSPPDYLSLQFGPPIFPADIVTNPYGPGAIVVAHILGQRDNNGPDAWYAPQPRDHFVNFIDGDGTKTDLYLVHPEEFGEAQEFQFLP